MVLRAKAITRLLIVIWALVIVWQVFEHNRVRTAARNAVTRRARDISKTLAVVIRSQRFWGGIVRPDRLESALNELVKSYDDLRSVALLNAAGETMVDAGEKIQLDTNAIPETASVQWDNANGAVTVVNPVDLGESFLPNGSSNTQPTIVLPPFSPAFSAEDLTNLATLAFKLKKPATPVDRYISDRLTSATKAALAVAQDSAPIPSTLQTALVQDLNTLMRGPSIYEPRRFDGVALRTQTQQLLAQNPQSGDGLMRLNRMLLEDAYPSELMRPRGFQRGAPPPDGRPPGPRPPPERHETNAVQMASSRTNVEPAETERRPDRRGLPRGPWRNEEERKAMIEKRGLHGLAMVLSTASFQATCTQDLWLRTVIIGFAAAAGIGLGLAWQNLLKSSAFQMRLVRASEMNTHLREMNVAAAGLAHETRNPLNIIRGLAQIISKAPDAADGIRKKSLEITEEVDRVTVQLNEFINYSKPREVRRSPVAITTVVNDVVRTLKSDIEDKAITLDIKDDNLTVNADQQLLRQVLFNLLINAIQAVDVHGKIQIVLAKNNSREASFEIRDDGPGVPEDQRKDIFRPYFTTREKGTGLGLAVVKQIVMVHGWEVECLSNNGKGAVFRVTRLELTGANPLASVAKG